MHRIPCPFCGPRDEAEFRYRGDATLRRPQPTAEGDAPAEAFLAYVYERENPRGWHLEWWQHAHGCRRVLKVQRHTLSHDIAWAGWPGDEPPPPPEERP
jgi:heterotetrameric sarcosine oxidase delta subunit